MPKVKETHSTQRDPQTDTEKSTSNSQSDDKLAELLSKMDKRDATLSELLSHVIKKDSEEGQRLMPSDRERDDVYTEKSFMKDMELQMDRVTERNRRFMEKVAKSPKSEYVTVTIPQMYRKYFGSTLPVGVNGTIISIPVNNRPYRIHKIFVPALRQRLNYKDEKISQMTATENRDIREIDSRSDLGQ